ncbi:hypothetical protein ERD95_15275, partial [Enterobacteriaceae bacterium ML5]
MNKQLSIEQLKELREAYANTRGVAAALDELIALKGGQVPVSMDGLRDAVAEMSGGFPLEWEKNDSKGHHAVPFINFNSLHRIVTKFTTPQKPVVWPDMPFTFEELEQMHGATFANGYVRGWARKCESVTMKGPLFTVPQKPVVLPKRLSPVHCNIYDTLGMEVDTDGGYLCREDVIAAIEAAGG